MVCRQNICYHVAAFVIPMHHDHVLKKLKLRPFDPQGRGEGGGGGEG